MIEELAKYTSHEIVKPLQIIQHDTIRYDTIKKRYDTIRYDTIRYDTIN